MAEPLSVRTPEEIEAVAAAAEEQRQRRRYILRALLHSPTFMVGAAILLFWIVMALFSTVFTADPYAVDVAHTLSPPGGAHLFGTDTTGRDVLARTLAGARPVLIIAPLATLLALIAGSMIGLVAGFYRGVVDEVLMRLVDVLLCLPVIVLALFVLSVLHSKSSWIVIVVIAIVFTPLVSRTVRSTVIGEREREYVMAARLRGERPPFIMVGEVLPNVLPPIIVEATVRLGYAVFTSATLSFLGQGLQPPSPDWGLTIAENVSVLQVAWWTVIFPAIALATLVVSVNLIADGLRRVLTR
jgi:peptide/nickel transport system permease protein